METLSVGVTWRQMAQEFHFHRLFNTLLQAVCECLIFEEKKGKLNFGWQQGW